MSQRNARELSKRRPFYRVHKMKREEERRKKKPRGFPFGFFHSINYNPIFFSGVAILKIVIKAKPFRDVCNKLCLVSPIG